jgi:hypothetical protein
MVKRVMTHFRPYLSVLSLVAFVASCFAYIPVYGQEAESKYRVLPPDPAGEKRRKEKDDLLNPEKMDLPGIEAYYKENLLPRLLQANAVAMNDARAELFSDIEVMERKSRGNLKILEDYNKMLARILLDVINGKDKDGKAAHPSSRVLAAVIAGRLNRQPASSQSGGLPDPEGTKILLRIFVPTENDGMVAAALTHLPRHWTWQGMDANTMELARKKFVSNVEAFLAAQKPAARGEEEEAYLRELMIENLTIIANGESESAKGAKAILLSLIKPALQKYKSESEWLVEAALHSFGQTAKPEFSAEELVELETNAIKFLQASLRSWNRRCAQTTAGAGGYPGMGGGGPGAPGGGFGLPGAGGGGGSGSEDGGEGGGLGGRAGAAPPKPKNAFEEQPKEVRVARRILHQRLEKIHYGLDGFGKAHLGKEVTKGLISIAEEGRRENLLSVINYVEALQKALNDDQIKDLNSLVTSTRTAVSNLQKACEEIVGSDGQVDLPVDAGNSDANNGGESGESGGESDGGFGDK